MTATADGSRHRRAAAGLRHSRFRNLAVGPEGVEVSGKDVKPGNAVSTSPPSVPAWPVRAHGHGEAGRAATDRVSAVSCA
jgi:hypothetical protein